MTQEKRVSAYQATKSEKELNYWRSVLYLQDDIEGYKTIKLKTVTAEALQDITVKEVYSSDTFDERILKLIECSKELQKVKENLGLNDIEIEEDD